MEDIGRDSPRKLRRQNPLMVNITGDNRRVERTRPLNVEYITRDNKLNEKTRSLLNGEDHT